MNETPADRTPEQVMRIQDAFAAVYPGATAYLRSKGFVVVPVEPTDKMVEAMQAEAFLPLARQNTRAVWRAAVAANKEGE
jgi:predicted CoA-binding protein